MAQLRPKPKQATNSVISAEMVIAESLRRERERERGGRYHPHGWIPIKGRQLLWGLSKLRRRSRRERKMNWGAASAS